MFGTDYFQIVHGEGVHVGELTPTGFTDKLEVGTAMSRHSTDPENYSVAGPGTTSVAGFLTKKITDDGPSFEEMTLGYPDLPAKTGQKVTIQSLPDGSLIEVEGADTIAHDDPADGLLVTDGTGAIASNTAAETQLGIKSGRWRVAQSGDYIEGVLKKMITPIVDDANLRALIEIRSLGIKP